LLFFPFRPRLQDPVGHIRRKTASGEHAEDPVIAFLRILDTVDPASPALQKRHGIFKRITLAGISLKDLFCQIGCDALQFQLFKNPSVAISFFTQNGNEIFRIFPVGKEAHLLQFRDGFFDLFIREDLFMIQFAPLFGNSASMPAENNGCNFNRFFLWLRHGSTP